MRHDHSPSFLTPIVWCILLCEAAERFAYFGFRAILVLYLTRELHFAEPNSIAIFAYVASLAYFTPLLGALLADGSWGRYITITRFGLMYLIGLTILTTGALCFEQDEAEEQDESNLDAGKLYWKRLVSFVGLFFICIGTGGIKPCVSAFGADQVESSESIRAFFAYFYFCINLGAVTSIFLVPLLKSKFGFGFAFLAPTLFIYLALTLFWSKRNEYKHHRPEDSLGNMFLLCGILLRKRVKRWYQTRRGGYLDLGSPSIEEGERQEEENYIDDKWSHQQLQDAEQTLNILPVLSMLPIFWMLYDQQGSVWTLQATRMALPYGIQPEQMNVINPVQIMLFIPLFDKCIYPFIERNIGHPLSHLSRMGWGMFLCALSFFASGILERYIVAGEERDQQVSIFWQLPQITILAVAEILLSVTGYDFCYSNSSSGCKALILALYLVTTAVGDFLAGLLYNGLFQDWDRETILHTCGILMLLNLLTFRSVAKWWNNRLNERSFRIDEGYHQAGLELVCASERKCG